jgi:hypothetical protein
MEISNNMFTIIAIVMAMGLVGVVAVDVITDAEAKGCPKSVAINASQGLCFNPGQN